MSAGRTRRHLVIARILYPLLLLFRVALKFCRASPPVILTQSSRFVYQNVRLGPEGLAISFIEGRVFGSWTNQEKPLFFRSAITRLISVRSTCGLNHSVY